MPRLHMQRDAVPVDAQQRPQRGPAAPALAADGQRQPGVGHNATAQHQAVAAAHRQATFGVSHGPDLAVGHHRQADMLADGGDVLPVGRRPVAMVLGARMHHQLIGAAVQHRLRIGQHARVVARAQPHLGRNRQLGRHRAPHRAHDAKDQLRLVQQHGAAAVAVDGLGRAAEIEVDAFGAQGGDQRRVVGQAGRVGPQQLRPHRHAGGGAAAGQQLGHDAGEDAGGKQLVGDADEFRHAAVDAAHAREHVAQAVVEQALHRGQQDAGGDGSRSGSPGRDCSPLGGPVRKTVAG